jgi:hypothetical protein
MTYVILNSRCLSIPGPDSTRSSGKQESAIDRMIVSGQGWRRDGPQDRHCGIAHGSDLKRAYERILDQER